MPLRAVDLSGQVIGEWTVLHRLPNRVSAYGPSSKVYYWCRCSCGAEREVAATALQQKTSRRCQQCGVRQAVVTRRDRRTARQSAREKQD